MGETTDYTFRTKTGTCEITPERILLTRDNARGALSTYLFRNSISRALLLNAVFGTAALVVGIWFITRGNYAVAIILCVVGIYFLYGVVASRNNSAAPIIDRSAIHSVEAHPPHPPASRGYFTVKFEENGKVRQRLIMLPGSMQNGQDEYKRAVAVMHASGLLPVDTEISV